MSEKGANNAMKWLRKRKKSDRAEATPALAANEQEEVAQEKTEYIEDKTQAAAWPARAHPLSPDQPLLEVRAVERTFQVGSQKLHVLKGIEMEVHPGQLVMLKGRSGSGKTTLLNMLGGLDLPTKGEIRFRGSRSRHGAMTSAPRRGAVKSGSFSKLMHLCRYCPLMRTLNCRCGWLTCPAIYGRSGSNIAWRWLDWASA